MKKICAQPEGGVIKNMSTVIAVISVLISGFALAVSIRSCKQTERSVSLQKAGFFSERLMVLTGKIADQSNNLSLCPIESDAKLLKADLYFPKAFSPRLRSAIVPDFSVTLNDVKEKLAEVIATNVPKKEGILVEGLEGQLQVIIEDYYIKKGESYSQRGIYSIIYQYSICNNVVQKLSLKGLVFHGRVPSDVDIYTLVDDLWESRIREMAAIEYFYGYLE